MILRALTLLVLATTAASAQAQPNALDPVLGVWRGKYICGQGVTVLQLTVSQGDGAPRAPGFSPVQKSFRVAAQFEFGPAKENPSVPNGSYAMTGDYYPGSRRIVLAPHAWRIEPPGYFMVGLDGRMTPQGDRITGDVPAPGCSVFELVRLEPLIS